MLHGIKGENMNESERMFWDKCFLRAIDAKINNSSNIESIDKILDQCVLFADLCVEKRRRHFFDIRHKF